jgi:hypothetical protein
MRAYYAVAQSALTAAEQHLSLATPSRHHAHVPGCPSYGWSIAGSSSTHSQLAGLLAGFVFTAVTILIARSGPRNTQALGLLSCAFVVLAFDSYLFSDVAGSSLDTNCARVWAQGVPAAGMLAVGGVAVVTGISWLLAARDDPASKGEAAEKAGITWGVINLDSLSRWMAFLVAGAVSLLLTATTYDYATYAFGGRDKHALGLTAKTTAAVVILTSIGLLLLRRFFPETKVARKTPALAFRLGSFGILAYAIVATTFVGYDTSGVGDPWDVALTTLFLGLIAPSVLLIALVHSVAPPIPLPGDDTGDHVPEPSASDDETDLNKLASALLIALARLPACPELPPGSHTSREKQEADEAGSPQSDGGADQRSPQPPDATPDAQQAVVPHTD